MSKWFFTQDEEFVLTAHDNDHPMRG